MVKGLIVNELFLRERLITQAEPKDQLLQHTSPLHLDKVMLPLMIT
jgi:hypothetical protein